MRTSRWSLLVLLALAPAACDGDGTGPSIEQEQLGADIDVAAAAFDALDVTSTADYSATFGGHPPLGLPVLGMLVREAYARVLAAEGQEAADALVAPLWQLHQEARAARRAGDRETFLAKLREAHEEAVRIVVDVLGTEPIERALEIAATRLDALRAVIDDLAADGRDVTRLELVYAQAGTWLEDANGAFEAGDYGAALSAAIRSAHLATHALGHVRRHSERHRWR